ncbi:MAG: HupE/UreJ family protein [Cytophagales bacterium]|nr:HupE/UreJ family protein [Cytophagales bacterium]
MSVFWLYFQMGWEHILDPNGYDHFLFLLALCTLYSFRDLKKVALLATAFTLGHTLTLILSTLKIIHFNTSVIEFLIPLTIMLTACANLYKSRHSSPNFIPRKKTNYAGYTLTGIFGLVHGMGFSNYLKSLLGKSENIAGELLAFNLGIEIAQLLVVLGFLILSALVVRMLGIKQRDWSIGISSGIIALAAVLTKEAAFW